MAKNTIMLKVTSPPVINEMVATAVAITPGMLLEPTSTVDTVQAHSTAGGSLKPHMFAIENTLFGGGVNDNYAVSAKIQTWIPQRGDEVYAFLKDDTTAVVVGDLLESAGGGLLQKHVPDVESFESADPGSITVVGNQLVGVALEALDLSGSSGAESQDSEGLGFDKRIKIRIL